MYRFPQIAFASLLLPVIAGIAIGYSVAPINLLSALIILSVALILFIVGLTLCRPPYKRYTLLAALMVVFFLISWMQTSRTVASTHFPYYEDERTYQIQVSSQPEENKNTMRFEAAVMAAVDSASLIPIDKSIFVSIAKDSLSETLQRGDVLLVHTSVVNPNKGNPCEFDYDDYLRQHGLCGTAYVWSNSWERLEHRPIRSLRAYAEDCQHRLSQYFLNTGIRGDEWGVICALTIGNRDGLDTEMRQHYSAAGAMHVLAVSGLHVGIVYGALLFLLTGFGFYPVQYEQKGRRLANTIFLVVALWAYAFLTGLSASVMRSALMFSLLTIGRSLERDTSTLNTIAASATIILLLHPLMLFSVSFVLSYSAVVSIVVLQPHLQDLLHLRKFISQKLWGLITVSTAAQLGTMPWTIYWFSQTSNWFILTNIIVVPAASLILYAALAVLLTAPIPVISAFMAKILYALTWLLNHYVEWVDSLPFSTSHISFSLPMLCCCCACVVCVTLAFVYRNRYWVLTALLCIVAILACDIYRQQTIKKQDELIVYNVYNANLLVHQEGNTLTILTDDTTSAMGWTQELRRKRCIRQVDMIDLSSYPIYTFRYADKDYVLVRDSVFEGYQLSVPETTDYLLLGDIGRVGAERILHQFNTHELILMPTLRRWKAQQLVTLSNEAAIPVHDIRRHALIIPARE